VSVGKQNLDKEKKKKNKKKKKKGLPTYSAGGFSDNHRMFVYLLGVFSLPSP